MQGKKFLALMMTIAVAGTAVIPAKTVEAYTLTQVTDPEKVVYGEVTNEEIMLLKQMFDAEYYAKQNPDVAKACGNDKTKLFAHFYTKGIFEGRACNEDFDASGYAAGNPDLFKKFGTDYVKYHIHYVVIGAAERKITNLKDCADNGITVHPLSNPEVSITPEVYYASLELSANDIFSLSALANAFEVAHETRGDVLVIPSSGSSSSSGTSSSTGTSNNSGESGNTENSETNDTKSYYIEAQKLTKIGTITIGDAKYGYAQYDLLVVAGETGYSVYEYDPMNPYYDEVTKQAYPLAPDAQPIYTTSDYSNPNEDYSNYRPVVVYFNDRTNEEALAASKAPAGNGYYEIVGDEIGEYPTKGVSMAIDASSPFIIELRDENDAIHRTTNTTKRTSQEANSHYHADLKLAGYVVDDEGNVKLFENEQEKQQFIKDNTVDNPELGEYSMYVEETYEDIYYDSKGTKDTVYDIGIDIKSGEDGSFNLTVGVSNEADYYGYITSFDCSSSETKLLPRS